MNVEKYVSLLGVDIVAQNILPHPPSFTHFLVRNFGTFELFFLNID